MFRLAGACACLRPDRHDRSMETSLLFSADPNSSLKVMLDDTVCRLQIGYFGKTIMQPVIRPHRIGQSVFPSWLHCLSPKAPPEPILDFITGCRRISIRRGCLCASRKLFPRLVCSVSIAPSASTGLSHIRVSWIYWTNDACPRRIGNALDGQRNRSAYCLCRAQPLAIAGTTILGTILNHDPIQHAIRRDAKELRM